MKIVLSRGGVITMEFPHLMRLMSENSVSTRYTTSISRIFHLSPPRKSWRATASSCSDVEELPTHGGSLRIYGRHEEDNAESRSGNRVIENAAMRTGRRFGRIETYRILESK